MTAAPLRYAATVMLVRDTAAGPEVLLLERSRAARSFSGAYVFPGGTVDLHDAHHDYERFYTGHTDQAASAILAVPRYGLAYWTGAIRECKDIPRIMPMKIEAADGSVKLLLPGDAGYDSVEVAETHY